MKLLIQKAMKTSLGNFASFPGHIALCFNQLLSCLATDSQKSLVVAIYSQTTSKYCTDLVKI